MISYSRRRFSGLAALCLAGATLLLAGCGGSPGVSSQVVSGVASAGATLAGQVDLKDASGVAAKTALIANDGSYSVDVTGMKAPFILQAKGSANGVAYSLNSFATGTGTANVNPLSHLLVASAAGVDDPFDASDAATLGKIGAGLPAATQTLQAKLQRLLKMYDAENVDPIGGHYLADHTGLDGMFDDVKITVLGGVVTVTNAKSGAVIFTGSITDLKDGQFTDDDNNLPGPPGAAGTPAVPAAPAGLTATGGANSVSLTWNAVANATSYDIYWSTQPGVSRQNGTKIGAQANSYLQSGLSAATSYYYVVSALNGAGEGALSAQASASTAAAAVAAAPAVPSGVSATGGTKQVTVAWTAVAGATSYNLYWSQTSGVTTGNGNKLSLSSTSSVLNNLPDGASYYYVVTAVNAVGESAASVQVAASTLAAVPVATVPAAPTGVSASGGAKQETVSWTPVVGAASYNLYWSTAPGVTPSTGTRVAAVSSPYVLTNLAAGTGYYYVVTALDAAGESAPSAQASASTDAAPPALPAAPTGVGAAGGANQLTVSWSAVSGATSYNLYYLTAAGVTSANGIKVSGVATPYTLSGLTAATPYYLVVTAVSAAGEGPASAQATATTAAAAPVFDAAGFYTTTCIGCHGSLGPRTAAQITSAIGSVGAMGKFKSTGSSPLSAAQISAIAAASY